MNNKIFIGNLSYDCTEEELQTLCEEIGPVMRVDIPKNEEGKGRGFAFVRFQEELDAARAIDDFNLRKFKGRILHLERAYEKPSLQPHPQVFSVKERKVC